MNFAETNFSTCSSPTATLTSHLWQGCQTSILQKKSINFVFTGMIFLSDFQKVDNLQNKRSTSIPRLNSSPIGQTFYIFSSSMEGLIFNTVNTHRSGRIIRWIMDKMLDSLLNLSIQGAEVLQRKIPRICPYFRVSQKKNTSG